MRIATQSCTFPKPQTYALEMIPKENEASQDKTSPKYSVNGEFILLTRKVVSTLTTLNSSVYGKKNSLRFLFGQIRNVSPRLLHLKDIKKIQL